MPFDELTGEEIDDDELEYRRQIRDALTTGVLRGEPQDDGSWLVNHPDNLVEPAPAAPEEVAPPPPAETVPPPEPATPEQTAEAITEQEKFLAAGMDNSVVDYVSRTAGVTAPLGGNDALRAAKIIDDSLSAFRGHPQEQGLRLYALDNYAEGLEMSGDPQKAYDYMSDAIKSRLGATNPTYQQFVGAGVRGGDKRFYDPATGEYKSGDENVDASARGKLRGELQARREGNSQYGAIATAVMSDQLLGAEIPYADKVRDRLKEVTQWTWDHSLPGVTTNAALGFAEKIFGVDLPTSGEVAAEVVGAFVPQTAGEGLLTLAPGIGDLRGAVVAMKTGSLGFGEKAIAKGALPKLPGAVEDLLRFTEGKPVTAMKESATLDKLWHGAMESVLHPLADATRNGKAAPDYGIDENGARQLAFAFKSVAGAGPDEMVTVYHGTDIRGAENIARDGFKSGGFVTTDPDTARIYASFEGRLKNEEPQVVAFQVPRRLLGRSDALGGASFTLKGDATPLWNEVSDGWVDNAAGVVKDFISGAARTMTDGRGLASERGSFLRPSYADEVPDDVARLAFGGSDEGVLTPDQLSPTNRAIFDALQDMPAEDAPRPYTRPTHFQFEAPELGPDAAQKLKDQVVGVRTKFGDFDVHRRSARKWVIVRPDGEAVETTTVAQTMEALGRGGSFYDSVDEIMQNRMRELSGMTNENLRREYERAIRMSQEGQDALDNIERMQREGKQFGFDATAEARSQMLEYVKKAQEFGEEMYRRSDGKDGIAPKIQRAIKQFLAEEDGAVRIPSWVGNADYRLEYDLPYNATSTGAKATVEYLGGDLLIDPHLRPVDKIHNAIMHRRGRVGADDLATQAVLKIRDAKNRATSVRNANVREMTELANRFFKADKEGFIEEFKQGKPPIRLTIQDLAAKFGSYKTLLKPEQVEALEKIRSRMEKLGAALKEQGIKISDRPDIEPGGFYLPRGDAFEDGFDTAAGETYREWGVVMPSKRGIRTGAERTAIFDSMAQGVDNGVHYQPFNTVMDVHYQRMDDRLINQYFANVFLNARYREEGGKWLQLAANYQTRLAEKYPQLADDVKTLRKYVTSLEKSIDILDAKTHGVIQKFIFDPLPEDFTELKMAVDAMTTQRGTLRIRDNRYGPADKFADMRVIWEEVNRHLYRSRGKYKGLTGEAAKQQLAQDAYNKLSILRGRFKGMDWEQAHKTLDNVKQHLETLAPAWANAMADVRRAGLAEAEMSTTLEAKGLGMGLQNTNFPVEFASVINRYLKSTGRASGAGTDQLNTWHHLNGYLKTLKAGFDASGGMIQGLLGLAHEPKSWGVAMMDMFKAMGTPDGERVLGSYIVDFNDRAAKRGTLTAQEWAAAGLRIGAAHTEQTGRSSIQGFKQAERGFGFFGDILRLDGADSILKHEMAKKGNAGKDIHQIAREIAQSQNLMTGWSHNRVLGDAGDYLFFAPRFMSSQFEVLHHALTDGSITGKEARSQLRNLLIAGVGITAAGNALAGDDDFNWYSPTVNGRINPNFMRIKTGIPGVGDVSVFGPWDALARNFVLAAQGDFKSIVRSKAAPMVGLLWDQIAGETFDGKKVPQLYNYASAATREITSMGLPGANEADLNAGFLGDYFVRQTLPFSYANPVADVAFRGKDPLEAAAGGVVGAFGVKASPSSPAERQQASRRDVINALINDGTIPADMADVYRNTSYFELPSSMRKFIDQKTAEKFPDLYREIRENKEERGDVYIQRQMAAEKQRETYNKEFDQIEKLLRSGENPYTVWTAYEATKNKLSGALNDVYNGKDAEEYRKAVESLPVTDFRRIEDGYNNIIGRLSEYLNKPVSAFKDEDWKRVEQIQQQYRQNLASVNPEAARVFEYSLKLREENQSESAHTLVRLRKAAQTELKPYYDLMDRAKNGLEADDAPQQWLKNNPHADYLHFVVTKGTSVDSNPTLHSVEAAELALKMFGDTDREIRLAGTKTLITSDNIDIFRQYSNEIMQLFDSPGSRIVNGKTTYPRTELRKRSATYDALYFWLGMSSPRAGEDTVTVYHLDAVQRMVEQWGPREDGAKPARDKSTRF